MADSYKGNEWISISDMMAGVMMIFLLIAVSYMVVISKAEKQLATQNAELKELNSQMRNIAKTHEDLQITLHKDLIAEFSKNLEAWNAEIDSDNVVRFREPEILFDQGKKEVKTRFQEILDDFFPRYIAILTQDKYKNDIDEIRIEGHTSTEWQNAKTLESRYLGNAELSQARALEVLKYCFSNTAINADKKWLVSVLRANGLSFARPLETPELSRRVEFRVLTKSNQRIMDILEINADSKDFAQLQPHKDSNATKEVESNKTKSLEAIL